MAKPDKYIEEQRDFYKVGRVIYCGYWRTFDKVLDFKIDDRGFRSWSVLVAHCTQSGELLDRPRWHSTARAKGDRVELEAVNV